jgi:integrase/recombinase XerC
MGHGEWGERDQAMVLTCLLAGLRTEELVRASVDDIQRTTRGAFIHVRGKNRKERNVPIEAPLIAVVERYLDSRAIRFPRRTRRSSSSPAGDWTGGPEPPLCLSASTANAYHGKHSSTEC